MEKLTVKEVAKDMNVDVKTLRAGLEQGKFPFGVAIKRHRMTYHIWKEKYEAWKEANDESRQA